MSKHSHRAPKARQINPTDNVVFNPVFFEKRNELVFKGFLSVVRLLMLNVIEDLMLR
ncbi:MAG: hypothetical protein ACT4OT_00635 [Acidobacteriota bacterium]